MINKGFKCGQLYCKHLLRGGIPSQKRLHQSLFKFFVDFSSLNDYLELCCSLTRNQMINLAAFWAYKV